MRCRVPLARRAVLFTRHGMRLGNGRVRSTPALLVWCATLMAGSAWPSASNADDAASFCAPAPFPEIVAPLALQPASIKLTRPAYPHSVLVTGTTADGRTIDLTANASFASADDSIARVDAQGWVHPVANGATSIPSPPPANRPCCR